MLIILPDFSNDRVRAIDGVFEYARACRDWHVETTIGDWRRLKEQVSSTFVTGLVVIRQLAPLCNAFRSWVAEQPFPTVLIQDQADQISSVMTDEHETLMLARPEWERSVLKQICLATRCEKDPLWNSIQTVSASLSVEAVKWVLPMTNGESVKRKKLEGECERLVSGANKTAVFATDPQLAVQLKAAANRCDIPVPEQLSIISASDNLECSLPLHSITAIEEPIQEMGFQAARMLDRIIQKTALPGEKIFVAPTKLQVRESCCSDFDHPTIALATNFIQQHAAAGITVDDVLKTQDSSRVTFERRFRQVTGQSPAEMIRKCRVAKAKDLLLETESPIAIVAQACGFSSTSKFSAFFSKMEGISPLKFRRRFGAHHS